LKRKNIFRKKLKSFLISYGIQISQLKKEGRPQHLETLTKLIKTSKAILKQKNLAENKLSNL
jgi:hypothetical protein